MDLIFGLTVVLSMTAFFMMYLINNEYTAKGEQPFRESFVWMIKMRRQSYIILPGNGNIFRESCLHLRC